MAATAELTFRAMGTDVHVVVVGSRGSGLDALCEQARRRIDQLERKWSRFLPDSELSRLNAAGGLPVVVSPETFEVIARAVDAWSRTGGRFDPTVHDSLVAGGYDRPFRELAAVSDRASAGSGNCVDGVMGSKRGVHPAPGCGWISLSTEAPIVTLPRHVRLDLGGIGKGRAADLVVDELLVRGASGACVNVGGDLKVGGEAPANEGWIVSVTDPFAPSQELVRLALRAGAVATSSRLTRTWQRDGRARHHLIDPSTGGSVDSGMAAVTVLAGDAVTAEVAAKAAFVAGSVQGPGVLSELGLAGVIVDDDGAVRFVDGAEPLTAFAV